MPVERVDRMTERLDRDAVLDARQDREKAKAVDLAFQQIEKQFGKGSIMKRAFGSGTTLDELVRARDHGVTPEYVQEIKALGFSAQTLEQFVRLRDHGVKSEYVKELRAAGYDKLAPEDIVRVRDHGVTAAYIRDLAAAGYKGLPIEDVVRTKDHGVSTDYIADMEMGTHSLEQFPAVCQTDVVLAPAECI